MQNSKSKIVFICVQKFRVGLIKPGLTIKAVTRVICHGKWLFSTFLKYPKNICVKEFTIELVKLKI